MDALQMAPSISWSRVLGRVQSSTPRSGGSFRRQIARREQWSSLAGVGGALTDPRDERPAGTAKATSSAAMSVWG